MTLALRRQSFDLVLALISGVLFWGMMAVSAQAYVSVPVSTEAQSSLIQKLQAEIEMLKKQFGQVLGVSASNNAACLHLGNSMMYRSQDVTTSNEVSALQDFLQANGYLKSDPTGFFGLMTVDAVKSFQKAYGLPVTGYVTAGDATQLKIKTLTCGTGTSTTTSTDDSASGPRITLFTQSATVVKRREPVTITWSTNNETANCSIYRISNENRRVIKENIGSATSYILKPSRTTEYVLSCIGRDGESVAATNFTITVSSNSIETLKITSAAFSQEGDAGEAIAVKIWGKNLGRIVTLEYQANCCKPIEGSLATGLIGKDSYATFNVDTYLGNAEIQSLKVRVIDDFGRKSNWEEVDIDSDDVETDNAEIEFFASKDPDSFGRINIMWRTTGAANVALDMECTPGTISFTTDKGSRPSCQKGGVWVWNNRSEGNIYVTASENTSLIHVPFTLTVLDEDGAYTSEKETIVIAFAITGKDMATAVVKNPTFRALSQIEYTTLSQFNFTLENWREGLVMDVEPYIICGQNIHCDDYLIALDKKAGESYTDVQGNPYVKGGALYRFALTGAAQGESITISSYPQPENITFYDDGTTSAYVPPGVIYTFILRDTISGGKTIWSKKYTVYNKG